MRRFCTMPMCVRCAVCTFYRNSTQRQCGHPPPHLPSIPIIGYTPGWAVSDVQLAGQPRNKLATAASFRVQQPKLCVRADIFV